MYQTLKLFSLAVIAMLSLTMAGCNYPLQEDVLQDCDNQKDKEVPCGITVTAVRMSCAGYGAFGNVYFLTDAGEYLQPWEMFPTFAPVQVTPGKRYVIGYKKVRRDNRYNDLFRCMLYDEKVEKATPVKLTCLTETACANTEATVSDKRPVDGCLEFVLNNGERLLADISHLNVTLEDGERIRFAYTIEDGIIPCGTRIPTIGKVAKIICIEKASAN
ncbi:hypothetical protein [Rhodoflexus caldus]|uniref:hypothetical protein n=1 Tax=Rhodoflexus caldus TaxID=2891236 RepID=UPI002029C5D3|nr:hypothetical protein [Rhodoflexus caldus]